MDTFTDESGNFYKAIIRYPRFQQLLNEIARCEELTRLYGEPQCMSLEAGSMHGKSTLMRTYIRENTVDGPPNEARRYFYVVTPPSTTVKGFYQQCLLSLGDPGYEKGSVTSMYMRIIHYIRELGISYVFVDEFHHLIHSDTERVLHTVSDAFKNLIKECKVGFLVAGIPGRVSQILDKNEQLSRLFAVREMIDPFRWEEGDAIVEFNGYINNLLSAANVQLPKSVERKKYFVKYF